AGQARPDLRGQRLGEGPGHRVIERALAQFDRGFQILVAERGRPACRADGRCEERECENGSEDATHGQVSVQGNPPIMQCGLRRVTCRRPCATSSREEGQFFLSASRISVSSWTSSLGAAGCSASLWTILLTALTTRKIASA